MPADLTGIALFLFIARVEWTSRSVWVSDYYQLALSGPCGTPPQDFLTSLLVWRHTRKPNV